jgi:hypothetical protein
VITKLPSRHPKVANRSLELPEALQEQQRQRGLWTVDRGQVYTLPIDHIKRKDEWRGKSIWTHSPEQGTHRKGVVFEDHYSTWRRTALRWLQANVNRDIPRWYFQMVLGHDLHVSTWGSLYAKHWHAGWADPITGEVTSAMDPSFNTLFLTHWVEHECDSDVCPRDTGITLDMLQHLGGFVENLGFLSGALVTTAFVSEEIDELVSTTGTEYADFDFHEVGTNAAAENNTHTALQTSSGIARDNGTPTDADPIYRNVGTITADVTETWEEHGLFNNSAGAAMMDRNLTGGQSVNLNDQVQYTFELTKNAEV